MKLRTRVALFALVIVVVAIVIFLRRTPVQEVSLILVNGQIHTVNDAQPLAEAVAIDKGTIVAVGSTREITSHFHAGRTVALNGRPVYPGFIDSHAHFENLGVALQNLNLIGASSTAEVQRHVAAEIASRPAGGWIRGRGWDQNRWDSRAFPDASLLDAVSPRNPVYLTRVDGHAVWVNSVVLRLTGINRSTRDPDGGRIVRYSNGNPTGVFIDNAVELLNSVLPQPDRTERLGSITRAVNECLRFGLTEVHDMGVDSEGIELYKSLIQEGKFPFRVYVAIESVRSLWEAWRASGPLTSGYDGRLVVRAIKLYADGALGSRGAALIEPYTDDPGNRGLTLTAAKELATVVRQAYDSGFQVCVHAIGDRANNMVLYVYADVLKGGKRDVRFRVEHAQVLDAADIPRFHELGVLPMMQPTHCTSDMPWAEDRLGAKRILGAYAWRSLFKTGTIIPAGSDFPVESPNPLLGFYAAITRQDTTGYPDGGWYPDQRMTREEALKAFTLWGAFAGFQEHMLGSIEPGKWADMVVLSDDIMTIPPRRIPSTHVVMTIVAGQEVYAPDGVGAASQVNGPTVHE